jgi:hypothetical protein
MSANLLIGPRETISPVIEPSDFGIEVTIERGGTTDGLNGLRERAVHASGFEFVASGQLKIGPSDFDLFVLIIHRETF